MPNVFRAGSASATVIDMGIFEAVVLGLAVQFTVTYWAVRAALRGERLTLGKPAAMAAAQARLDQRAPTVAEVSDERLAKLDHRND